jgi:hypothetical protein
MPVDLFGFESQDPVPPARPPVATNDMRSIIEVLERAVNECGYVIVGPSRRVYRRTNYNTMKQIPRWELETVLQLIDSGQLILGGHHVLRCGAIRQTVNSVLVPKPTRQNLNRWNALKPLNETPAGKEKKGA